jgi:hypothetical protein
MDRWTEIKHSKRTPTEFSKTTMTNLDEVHTPGSKFANPLHFSSVLEEVMKEAGFVLIEKHDLYNAPSAGLKIKRIDFERLDCTPQIKFSAWWATPDENGKMSSLDSVDVFPEDKKLNQVGNEHYLRVCVEYPSETYPFGFDLHLSARVNIYATSLEHIVSYILLAIRSSYEDYIKRHPKG